MNIGNSVAILKPFDFDLLARQGTVTEETGNFIQTSPQRTSLDAITPAPTIGRETIEITRPTPLQPIIDTGGLRFQFTPSMTETIQVEYDTEQPPHTNEGLKIYRATPNRTISLSNIVFTADTEENARYVLAVIHFFRTYSLMSYGAGGDIPAGRPPSPMWFTAYGPSMYDKVPVIMEGADITTSDPEQDLVSVTDFDGNQNWVPRKLTIGSINLTVQHPANFWRNANSSNNLEAYRRGDLIRNRENG